MKVITNKNGILESIKQFGFSLEYASDELKNDREIVLEAIKNDSWNLQFASERLQNDKDFLKEIEKIKI